MRRLTVVCVLSVLVLGLGIAGGRLVHSRWNQSFSPKRVAAGQATSGQELKPAGFESSEAGDLTPVRLGAEMSAAAETGKLPEPLKVAIAEPDLAAADLARRIARRDGESTAAVVAAVRAAGFKIRGEDGKAIFPQDDPGQGIAFDSWEVAAMAESYGDGTQMMLDDLNATFTQTLPGFKNIPLGKLLVEGIRADAESKKPALRFWARLIVELGRQARPSYDLLSPDFKSSSAQIDSVQFGLILRRLAADLAILGRKKGEKQTQAQSMGCPSVGLPQGLRARRRMPGLLEATWNPDARFGLIETADHEGPAAKLPCTLPEPVLELLDALAYVNGSGFDHLMEKLGEEGFLTELGGKVAARYGIMTTFANAVLVYAKLYWTAVSMHVNITMDGTQLVRTLNVVPGCRRKLKAKIEQKIGNWQLLNCLRMAFNIAGFDFSLPQDGPVRDVKTQWLILKGKTTVSHEDSSITYAIVEWVGHGPRIQDPGTYAGIAGVAPGIAVSDFTQATTDEKGEVEIDIEGAPRKNSIIGKAVPVMKQAEVQLIFAAKPPKLSQDLIDAGGGALGLLSNPIGLLTTVPVEMILRSRWFHSPIYVIPVMDWEECSGGWSGTITYTNEGECSNCAGFGHRSIRQRVSLHITTTPAEQSENGTTRESITGEGEFENDADVSFIPSGTESDRAIGHVKRVPVSLSISSDGHYSINIVNAPAEDSTWSCQMHLVADSSRTVSGSSLADCAALVQLSNVAFTPGEGTIDPKTPGKIHGSKPSKLPDSPGEMQWDLHYCSYPDRGCSQN